MHGTRLQVQPDACAVEPRLGNAGVIARAVDPQLEADVIAPGWMSDDMRVRGVRQPATTVWPAGMVRESHDVLSGVNDSVPSSPNAPSR
jgi:hypothetical protein